MSFCCGAALDAQLRKAEDGAAFARQKIGQVPPKFRATKPSGLGRFLASTMADEWPKDHLDDTVCLIRVGYGTAAATRF